MGCFESEYATLTLDRSSLKSGLSAQACQMVATFEGLDMQWKDESNVEKLFHLVSQSMLDPALPVRVQAALALPELVRYERSEYFLSRPALVLITAILQSAVQ